MQKEGKDSSGYSNVKYWMQKSSGLTCVQWYKLGTFKVQRGFWFKIYYLAVNWYSKHQSEISKGR